MFMEKNLHILTLEQAHYAMGALSDFIANDGPRSDDGHDATTGALDLVRIMMDFDFDHDYIGADKWFTSSIPFVTISVDGFCPSLYRILDDS